MVYIFVLKLEDEKYYIGCCNTPDRDIKNYLNGNSSSEWTRKYKPIKVLEMISPCDIFDTDKHTKRYMGIYGVNNVRGGAYQDIRLSKSDYNHIDKEIFTALGMCIHCGSDIHLSKDCYHISLKWQFKNLLSKIRMKFIDVKEQIKTCINNTQNISYDTLIQDKEEIRLLDNPIHTSQIETSKYNTRRWSPGYDGRDMFYEYDRIHLSVSPSYSPSLSPISYHSPVENRNILSSDDEPLMHHPITNRNPYPSAAGTPITISQNAIIPKTISKNRIVNKSLSVSPVRTLLNLPEYLQPPIISLSENLGTTIK